MSLTGLPSAIHRGTDDLPFVPVGDGSYLQLVHVDLEIGVWIARQRFDAGTVLQRHRHTGPVDVFTLSGSWRYLEYNDVNTAGSYLYEPAGSVHTFAVDPDAHDTDIWFAIYGSNLNLTDEGEIDSVYDAASVLAFYHRRCQQLGLPRPEVISR